MSHQCYPHSETLSKWRPTKDRNLASVDDTLKWREYLSLIQKVIPYQLHVTNCPPRSISDRERAHCIDLLTYYLKYF